MEEWRDVVGYEGRYQVSNCGRIKSFCKNKSGEILKIRDDRNGYKFIILYKNKKPKGFNVHRLVATAFIPNPDNLPEVNHIDECKWNNYIDNLEWCDREYNNNYGTKNERNSKSHNKRIKCVTTGEIFESIKKAGEKYNIYRGDISSCCRGKQKSAGKHPVTGEKMVWEYYEE